MPNKVSSLNQVYPTDCAVLMAVRADYADWNWGYHKGYIRYNLSGKLYYEHQLVAGYSHQTGPSNKHFHAHHKNTIKTDNRASNVQLLTCSEHSRIQERKPANTVQCSFCSQTTKKVPANVKAKKHLFCSRACYLLFVRTISPLGAGSRI